MGKMQWKMLAAMAVGAAVTYGAMQAQQTVQAQRTPTLTALDYAEIQQLANRYPYLIPTCDGEGVRGSVRRRWRVHRSLVQQRREGRRDSLAGTRRS